MGQNFSAEKEDYACRGRVKNIIIFTLVIVIIFLSKCVGDNEVIVSEPITIIETETLLDTIETVTTKTLWKTNTHFIYDTVIINVPIKVDTLNIIQKYRKKNVCIDTLQIDSIGYVQVIDTIYNNSTLSRNYIPEIDIPIKTIRTVENINKLELYAGFGARYNMEKVNWMGLEGGVKNKKGNLFILGIGTDTENNLSVGGSIHWKLKSE